MFVLNVFFILHIKLFDTWSCSMHSAQASIIWHNDFKLIRAWENHNCRYIALIRWFHFANASQCKKHKRKFGGVGLNNENDQIDKTCLLRMIHFQAICNEALRITRFAIQVRLSSKLSSRTNQSVTLHLQAEEVSYSQSELSPFRNFLPNIEMLTIGACLQHKHHINFKCRCILLERKYWWHIQKGGKYIGESS